MAPGKVLDWLLEEDQPSVRYRTLRDSLGRPESDSEVRDAKRKIPGTGWVAKILSQRDPGGWWVDGTSLYRPKYLSTNWQLIVLSDLGLTRDTPPVERSCELWMTQFAAKGGGVGGNSGGTAHHCVAGNQARSLIRFGYADDPRVLRTLEWLVETAAPKGGWSCWGSGRNLDSWEGLSAFAVYPRSKWTGAMTAAVERGAEFFLERELHRQGDHYAPWFRLHYPQHYYYDLLVGLDVLTRLGYRDDPRLRFALAFLKKKRRKDGRWNLDALHPDLDGKIADWYRKHPKQRPTPQEIEAPGKPSKMVTLIAQTVLDRVEGTAPRTGSEV